MNASAFVDIGALPLILILFFFLFLFNLDTIFVPILNVGQSSFSVTAMPFLPTTLSILTLAYGELTWSHLLYHSKKIYGILIKTAVFLV